MPGFSRMKRVQRVLRSRQSRSDNNVITDRAYDAWLKEFHRIVLPERDVKGCLWQFRIPVQVTRFYFHAGYSPKGAADEIVELFTSRTWHMLEMRPRIREQLIAVKAGLV